MNEEINEELFKSFAGFLSKESLVKALLRDVILDNKRLVYSIVTREPEQVLKEFNATEANVKTENYFETQYYSVTHDFATANMGLLTRRETQKIIGFNEMAINKTLLVKDSQK